MKVSALLRGLLFVLAVASVIGLLTVFLPQSLVSRAARLVDWNTSLLQFGELQITPAFLIKTILFLAILLIGSKMVSNFVRERILIHIPIDQGQKFAIARVTGYLIFAVGLLVGVQALGLNLSSLAFVGGAVGIGVGLGLQTIANNFVSGLILLFERPIKVGDRVEVQGLNGDVVNIAGRSTWIRTNDNVVIIVPNSEFIGQRVTNWTANDRQVRFSVPLGVSYGSDPDHVRKLLLELARVNPDVLVHPAPDVIFVGFGDSSLDFELRVWTTSRVQTPHILRSDLYFIIFKAFAEQGIQIPFPQRDLHLRSVSDDIPSLTQGVPADQP